MSNNRQFTKLLKEAYNQIKLKKFGRAITKYNQILMIYSQNKLDYPKLRKDIKTLFNEINLYLNLNEAYARAKQGNFGFLDQEVRRIHDATYEIENNIPNAFTYHNNKFLLDIYPNKMTVKQFEQKYRKIKNLIDGDLENSLREFTQLILVCNKIKKQPDIKEREKLYSKIKELHREIVIKKVFSLPKQRYKLSDFKPIKIEEKQLETKEERKLGTSFKQLHDEIKKSNFNNMLEAYENL